MASEPSVFGRTPPSMNNINVQRELGFLLVDKPCGIPHPGPVSFHLKYSKKERELNPFHRRMVSDLVREADSAATSTSFSCLGAIPRPTPEEVPSLQPYQCQATRQRSRHLEERLLEWELYVKGKRHPRDQYGNRS